MFCLVTQRSLELKVAHNLHPLAGLTVITRGASSGQLVQSASLFIGFLGQFRLLANDGTSETASVLFAWTNLKLRQYLQRVVKKDVL